MNDSTIKNDMENSSLENQINSFVLGMNHSRDDVQVSRLISAFHLWTENMLTEIYETNSSEMIDCRAGCGHCCTLTVRVLPVEAIAIENHLKKSVSAENLHSIVVTARELERDMSYLDDMERQLLRRSCPFLGENKHCIIHPVRPLLCRSVSSIRSEDCLDAIAALSFGESMPVTMHLGQKDFFDSAFISLSTALTEAGLSGESRCLTAAVAAFESIDQSIQNREVSLC